MLLLCCILIVFYQKPSWRANEGALGGFRDVMNPNISCASDIPVWRKVQSCVPDFESEHASTPLCDRQIDEFRKICKEALGFSLTTDEACIEAHGLTRLYELLARPLPVERVWRNAEWPSTASLYVRRCDDRRANTGTLQLDTSDDLAIAVAKRFAALGAERWLGGP